MAFYLAGGAFAGAFAGAGAGPVFLPLSPITNNAKPTIAKTPPTYIAVPSKRKNINTATTSNKAPKRTFGFFIKSPIFFNNLNLDWGLIKYNVEVIFTGR
jgi:hypothetical protein